jgi:hypothetical protein
MTSPMCLCDVSAGVVGLDDTYDIPCRAKDAASETGSASCDGDDQPHEGREANVCRQRSSMNFPASETKGRSVAT